jgi:PIN domain nuclease of toxin-antitoxin system
MNYLIDTQILIWYQLNSGGLHKSNYDLLTDRKNNIFVSQISLFEIAIKQKIGKLPELDLSINDLVGLIERDDFNLLTLQNKHIEAYSQIPFLVNHRDPFDRLLLATALSENMAIMSADENFKSYAPQISVYGNG